MTVEPTIRTTHAGDGPGLDALYSGAFPNDDLVPLVTRLLAEVPDIVSLAANGPDGLAGHVLFTPCGVGHQHHCVALAGPLAVAPSLQRRGIGTALVRDGCKRLRSIGLRRVLVLGDPNYYGRFGFHAEWAIRPPYDLPAQWAGAWQSLALDDGSGTITGTLRPPAAWMIPALWAP